MALRETIRLVDDLDGTEATQRVPFALDGITYDIDLSDENAARFRAQLAGYIGHARRIGGRKRAPGVITPTVTSTGGVVGVPASVVRDWGNSNGFTLLERGRVPRAVTTAYHAAMEREQATKKPATVTKRPAVTVEDPAENTDTVPVPVFSAAVKRVAAIKTPPTTAAKPPVKTPAKPKTPAKVTARKAAAKNTAKGTGRKRTGS